MRAYKTNGKPLSAEALYHQRMRQGTYATPGVPTVGVQSNASDTAALLAASSDLTVKPSYERLSVALEAQEAALAAKQQEVKAWKRERVDPNADSAAAFSLTHPEYGLEVDEPVSASVLGVPQLKLSTLYQAASKQLTSTMTSRINPEHNPSRKGLSTSGSGRTQSLNLGKITAVATQNSNKSLSSRFNPGLDYRSGLLANKGSEYLDALEEDLAAEGAAASLKLSSVYSNKRNPHTFTAASVVNAKLLDAANLAANERLKSLSSLNSGKARDFKAEATAYAGALALAQKRSEERIKSYQNKEIYIGGGKTISQAELDALASRIVQPVLEDITKSAEDARQKDAEESKHKANLVILHQKARDDEAAAKLQEKQDLEAAKQERIVENDLKMQAENVKYDEYQTARHGEVDQKNTEFIALTQKHDEEREALLAEQREEDGKVDAEEEEKKTARNTELEEMQSERDEEIAPLLEELKEESAKLAEITERKEGLSEEVDGLQTQNDEATTKLEELKAKLEAAEAEIEEFKGKNETSQAELDELTTEVGNLKTSSAVLLALHATSNKELDDDIEKLSKDKEEKAQQKIDQKKEIKDELDLKVKEEHKINEELPEHLKKTVNESKIKDTASLFTVETNKASKNADVLSQKAPSIHAPVSGNAVPERKKTFKLKSLSLIFNKKAAAPVAAAGAAGAAGATSAAAAITPAASVAPATSSLPPIASGSASVVSGDDFSLKDKNKNNVGVFKEEI